MSTPASPEAVKLYRLLSKIEEKSTDATVLKIAQERDAVLKWEADQLVVVPPPEPPKEPLRWNGTAWVSDRVAPPPVATPSPVGRIEGNFVPPAVTLDPSQLPGSPQVRLDGVYHEPSPTRPALPQPTALSPAHAVALATAGVRVGNTPGKAPEQTYPPGTVRIATEDGKREVWDGSSWRPLAPMPVPQAPVVQTPLPEPPPVPGREAHRVAPGAPVKVGGVDLVWTGTGWAMPGDAPAPATPPAPAVPLDPIAAQIEAAKAAAQNQKL